MRNKNHINGNAAQMHAIQHVNGPALVVAGPGSGKTFVIIQRVRYLIEDAGISPSSILVITFTKAAAIEMQQRFFKLTDSGYPEVAFGTFHSIFYNILRISGNYRDIRLISEPEKYNIMSTILKGIRSKYRINIELGTDIIMNIFSEISRIKNEGDEELCCNESTPLKEYFKEIYCEYNEQLHNLDKIDFDDMISRCYEFLISHPGELDKWQEHFKYILVDEAQDINNAQWKLLVLLSGKNRNIFMVGDDDQSIYGFRGSKPEILMDFKTHYPESENILLNVNYRCAQNILEDSLLVIGENKNRIQKAILSGIDRVGHVDYIGHSTQEQENSYIIKYIKENAEFENEIAILCRTNNGVNRVTQMLMSSGIKCAVVQKVKPFFEGNYICDVLSYLRFAYFARTRNEFIKIMNKPCRYIKRQAVQGEVVTREALLSFYKDNVSMQSAICCLFKDIDFISKLKPYLAIKYVRSVMKYDEYAIKDKNESDRREILSLLDELEDKAREYADGKAFFDYVDDSILTMNKELEARSKQKKSDGVRIMTFHASKGLEFDHVLIPDVNEGVIPGRRAITESEIEEERRMFYVAMTRARKELHIMYLTGQGENSMLPSRFIKKLVKQSVTSIK